MTVLHNLMPAKKPGPLTRCLLALMVILVAPVGKAQDDSDQHNFVKVTLEPAKAVVGQHMKLNVVVGVDTYFANAPKISLPNIEHALVLETEPSVNMGQRINGTYFATQLRQIDIYPDQEGIIMIPSFTVSLSQSVTVDGEITEDALQLPTEALLGIVTTPAEMQNEPGFLVSPDVQIDDQWNGLEKSAYQVGDLIERVVTVTATDTSAMIMPQFTPIAPKGVSVIMAEPAISSTSGRDGVSSTMVQHMSYAIEKPGSYQLGNENLAWWDPLAGKRHDHLFATESIDAGGVAWRMILTIAILLLAASILVYVLLRFLAKRDKVDLSIRKKLRSGDAGNRLAGLYAFSDYHQPDNAEPARLRFWLASALPLIEKIMTARFSTADSNRHSPSRRQTKTLFRHLKKELKR